MGGVIKGKMILDSTVGVDSKLDISNHVTDMGNVKSIVNVEAMSAYSPLVHNLPVANSVGIYSNKADNNYYFKSIYSSNSNLTIDDDGNGGIKFTVNIPTPPPVDDITISNVGGGAKLFKEGTNYQFKTLVAEGQGVSFTEEDDVVVLNYQAPEDATIVNNESQSPNVGYPLYKEGTSHPFVIRQLVAGDNINISNNSDDNIVISVTDTSDVLKYRFGWTDTTITGGTPFSDGMVDSKTVTITHNLGGIPPYDFKVSITPIFLIFKRDTGTIEPIYFKSADAFISKIDGTTIDIHGRWEISTKPTGGLDIYYGFDVIIHK